MIKIKRIVNGNTVDSMVLPTKGSDQAAGWDLYANIPDDIYIWPGDTKMIGTGIAMEIPEGEVGLVFPRSGLATKRGLRLANSVGVIDSDYRGEIMVPLHNDSSTVQRIAIGTRIAQLVIVPYDSSELTEVDELSDTDRGEGGFGSSGS